MKLVALTESHYFSLTPAGQWLNLRLQLVGCAVVTGVATIAVIQQHGGNSVTGYAVLSPGLVGLAISYALGITSKLSGLVTTFTETEREMVAVERCQQYIEGVPQENIETSVVVSSDPVSF